jgi:PAS domain S-box-containing protein
VVKAITAVVSVLTVAMLIPLVPRVISLPGRMYLDEVNRKLKREIAERKRVEEAPQESPVAGPVKRLNVFASASAVFAVGVGLLGLAGWELHIATLDTWGAPPVRIVPNAAVGCVLLGVALWLLRKEGSQSFAWSSAWARKLAARTAAGIVCLMGLLVLAEHVFGWDFGIDQMLFVVPLAERIPGLRPGLISTSAACDFILLGSALLLLDWKTRRETWPAQYLSFGAAIVAIFGFFALLLAPGPSGLIMAFPAAVTFLVLASGLLCSRATWAVGGLLISQNAGARLLRSAIPAALLILGLIGWSVSKALLTEAHFTWVEASLLAILCGVILVAFLTWIAFIVDRSDALSAELERRVARRTAALQSEIAERTLAQEALKESLATSEAALQELAEQKFALDQHAIVAVTDLQGTITYVNDRFSAMTHYSREEAIGQNYRIVNSGHHPKEFFQQMYDTIGKGAVWHGELRNRAKDGSLFWVDATIVPLLDSGGKPRQYITIRTDITERKRAEEVRERLAAVVESSDDAIISKTLDGTITAWNFGAEKVFGYSSARAVGKSMGMLLPPERMNEESDILARIRRGERLNHFETVRVRKDGKRVDISATISPVKDSNGAIVGAATIARDITERKAAELEIRKLNDELEERVTLRTAQLEAANNELADQRFAVDQHAIVAVTDIEGAVTYANDKFCAISQYSRDELIGHDHRMMKSGHHPKEFFQQMYDTIAEGTVWHGEIKNRAKDGSTYWLDTTIVPFLGADGKPRRYVAIRTNITERKQAEERLLQRTAELETANHELEAFSYSVSHDLRAPLRHISGFSQMLVEEFGPTLEPGAQHYLDRIQAGTQRMGVLVDELLNMARLGRHALRLQPTRLNSVVADVLAILQPESAGRQVKWVIADLPAVECDPGLVRQVFQNLLANALKFTRPRAHAVIEVNYKKEEPDGQVVFMVRDNGVGFSMKYVDKLFGVFQRLHRAEDFEGTGIGLATVQRIVHKHGGRVWAEAELDEGAAFYFTLGAGKQAGTKSNGATAGGQS